MQVPTPTLTHHSHTHTLSPTHSHPPISHTPSHTHPSHTHTPHLAMCESTGTLAALVQAQSSIERCRWLWRTSWKDWAAFSRVSCSTAVGGWGVGGALWVGWVGHCCE